jgi:hypothetical protein
MRSVFVLLPLLSILIIIIIIIIWISTARLAASPFYSLDCMDDQSCSFNGICVRRPSYGSYCQCDPGWTGVYCESLDLAPVHNGSGLQDLLTSENRSTWGGSVLFHPQDGLYHMWLSEITHRCGIHRWVSNSVVSHAVSRGPAENWKFHKTTTLFPIFTHEPIAARDPETGDYGLFISHYPNGSAADSNIICHCLDGSTSTATAPECHGEPGLGENKSMFTYFTIARSPYGPWGPLQSLELETPQKHVDLNFAPIILNNRTLLAWSRWDIWTATDWRNPTTYAVQGQAPNFSDPNGNWEGEDPSMWRDAKGRFHTLSHNGERGQGGTSTQPLGDCGRHLFSATGRAGTWITAPSPLGGCAYPRVNVSFADGTVRSFYRRERPHLIFDAQGIPVALSTAVIDSPRGPFMPDFLPPQRDASYTMVQSVNSHTQQLTARKNSEDTMLA